MKGKRKVVSKDAEKTRQPKSTSFDLTNAYEVGLLNYAEDPMHGDFSKYIKRLISFHKEGLKHTQALSVDSVETEEDDDSVDGFL